MLVRGVIVGIWAEPLEKGQARRVDVEFAGDRPPFTRVRATLTLGEIEKAMGESVEKPELKLYDKVRNEQGREYEVIAEPRAVENGLLKVALWNEEIGFDWDYPENLEVIS